jgi:hypothetical protein
MAARVRRNPAARDALGDETAVLAVLIASAMRREALQ